MGAFFCNASRIPYKLNHDSGATSIPEIDGARCHQGFDEPGGVGGVEQGAVAFFGGGVSGCALVFILEKPFYFAPKQRHITEIGCVRQTCLSICFYRTE